MKDERSSCHQNRDWKTDDLDDGQQTDVIDQFLGGGRKPENMKVTNIGLHTEASEPDLNMKPPSCTALWQIFFSHISKKNPEQQC